ncbi:GDSL esterase/lipase LTL1-like [Cynara cardunculus var. scolymus]|uniref:GDSL esterase/lipase LTL1-like n=1 Tax=Cynara cardunculus var. scolymus TaxID=59895 RepID=UPI000D626803|nr:GDSL esterase/lipase LTL1-like [Cynara cardunculus var. scolymus]
MIRSQVPRLCLVFRLCLVVGVIVTPGGTHAAPIRAHGALKGPSDSPNRTHVNPSKPITASDKTHVISEGNTDAPNGTHATSKTPSDSPTEAPTPAPASVASEGPSPSPKEKQVRPFFVFGDSLVDNGNNNFLYTSARADTLPYGIDSPGHQPTGRFSNGLNIPDVISEYIGSEPLLPYLNPKLNGKKLLVGANFASAGIGILNDTGFQFMNVLRMPLQLNYFKEYQQRLSSVVGVKRAKELVNQALVLVSLGGNDFVNNYYLYPFSLRSQSSMLVDYVPYVISEYRNILVKLYDLGARRVIVMGPGRMGCAPAERAQHSLDGGCAPELQNASALFQPQLEQMTQELNAKYGSDIFIGANAPLINHDMITDPQSFGFISSSTACCGQGPFNGLGTCTQLSFLCENRDQYVFWDAFHPSERASRLIVHQIMNGAEKYMKPMNLSTIMHIDSYM